MAKAYETFLDRLQTGMEVLDYVDPSNNTITTTVRALRRALSQRDLSYSDVVVKATDIVFHIKIDDMAGIRPQRGFQLVDQLERVYSIKVVQVQTIENRYRLICMSGAQ